MSFSVPRVGLIFSVFAVLVGVGCASNDDSASPAGTAGTAGAAGSNDSPIGNVGGGSERVGQAGNGDASEASTSGGAGAAEDRSYPCGATLDPNGSGGEATAGSAGEGGVGASSVAALSCVVGQTYCYVLAGQPAQPGANRVLLPQCRTVQDGAEACADAPTCACLCASGSYHCETECRCQEFDGLPTMTCDQI